MSSSISERTYLRDSPRTPWNRRHHGMPSPSSHARQNPTWRFFKTKGNFSGRQPSCVYTVCVCVCVCHSVSFWWGHKPEFEVVLGSMRLQSLCVVLGGLTGERGSTVLGNCWGSFWPLIPAAPVENTTVTVTVTVGAEQRSLWHASMLSERGLGLVLHFPSLDIAKISIL
jgi:hypothetical protein